MASRVHFSVSQLSRLIGTVGTPAVLGVHTDEHSGEDPILVPSHLRESCTFEPMLKVVALQTAALLRFADSVQVAGTLFLEKVLVAWVRYWPVCRNA